MALKRAVTIIFLILGLVNHSLALLLPPNADENGVTNNGTQASNTTSSVVASQSQQQFLQALQQTTYASFSKSSTLGGVEFDNNDSIAAHLFDFTSGD